MRSWLLLLLAAGLAPADDAPPCPVVMPRTVCLPETQTKTKTHTCYRCKCRTICLTCKPHCCRKGDCCECGKPREVRVLIKRFVKEETPELKCKPHEVPVPVCPPGCAPAGRPGGPR